MNQDNTRGKTYYTKEPQLLADKIIARDRLMSKGSMKESTLKEFNSLDREIQKLLITREEWVQAVKNKEINSDMNRITYGVQ